MYKINIFLLPFLLVCISLSLSAQPRQSILFNDNWKFYKGNVTNGQSPDLDDGNWRSVDLPHDWSIEGPFSEEWASATGYLPGGTGWYRKTFVIPSALRSKNIYLYFDGVYKNSEVWINGHYLGRRPNGFIPFQYEITKYVRPSGRNVVAVKADHSQFADSRWYTGSGIYRNVYMIAVEPVHISLWGVGFSTPVATPQNASAKLSVAITNNTGIPASVTIKSSLADSAGKIVAVAQKKLSVIKTASSGLIFNVTRPRLWSVGKPSLYRLSVSLFVNGKKTDEWSDNVGIRSIRFDPDQGFFLNGQNMKLKGVCIHDDAGALGVAVPEEVWERRLIALKEAGCNSLRMSHNPHADCLYKLCDRLGFLVMDEAFDEWEVGKNKWIQGWNAGTPGKDGYHEYFKEWAQRDLRDMVLRNRNRPSVIMWSIGNEIDYPNDPYSHEILNTGQNPQIYGRGYLPDHPAASRLGELSKELVAVVKKYDSSRPVTAALAGVVMSNTTTYPQNVDIAGYNYQEYRYAEDHKKYPGRVIYGSENGMQLSAWNAVDSNSYISGQFLWTGIDYLGEAGKWPARSNGAGLLDLAGLPKPEYYFRQSLWTDKPMIYIGTSATSEKNDSGIWSHKKAAPSWNFEDGARVRISCFTNCEAAELFLNGESKGIKKLSEADGRVINWDLDYAPGELKVKGYNNNTEAAQCSLKTCGPAYALDVKIERGSSLQQKAGMIQALIVITDSQGTPVFDAQNEISVEIDGDAVLAGLESGSHTSHEDYKANSRKAWQGKVMAYIKVKKPSSPVKLTFRSEGLVPQTTIVAGL